MVRSSSPATVGWYGLIPIYIGLAAIVLAVFGQTAWFDFVNYDDGSYVFDNANIRAGLTWHGVIWAFTHIHSQNWHPLTSISHMFDCQISGLNAGGHHLTNVLLHTAAVILLFEFLRTTTAAPWASAAAAVIFAVVTWQPGMGPNFQRYIFSTAGIFFWQRVLFGLFSPGLLSYLTWETAKIQSTQSATGILYVDFFTVIVGEVLAKYLLLSTTIPV